VAKNGGDGGNGRRRVRDGTVVRSVFRPGSIYRENEVYRSMIRHPKPDTPRGRAMTSFNNFFLHIYPVKTPRKVLSFRSTFRLGFISAVLFVILFISGTYLMFFYTPAVPDAYFDMHALATTVAFGQFVRNIHRWSAHLMVLVVLLHMVRVFYSGAYRRPRQFNWVIGMGLLVLTLALSFTGYLLPWDQLAFWAITVGTTIAGYVPILGDGARHILLGSNEVGAQALLRFYVLHIYVLPMLVVLLLSVHIWRVRKDGFAVMDREPEPAPAAAAAEETAEAVAEPVHAVAVPTADAASADDGGAGAVGPPGERAARYRVLGTVPREAEVRVAQEPDDSVFSWPHMLVRHVVVGAATVVGVFILAILFNAPLKDIANPDLTPEVAKAPWYFAGLQELLAHYQPMIAGVLAPGAAMAFLTILPYIDRSRGWRVRDRKLVVVVFSVLAVAALLLTLVGTLFRGPGWTWVWPWQHMFVEL
jgi:quinol-cytochrome oxidoreductase complex cytochrome b subunit